MAFFKNLFKPQPPAPKPPPPVPAQLPKISSPSAADLAQHSQPSLAAQKLLTPQQTPAQHLQAMQDQHLGNDMVKTLAHGMPDREGVHWATQSADTVSCKLPPHEVQGLKAAQAWVKNPTPANQAAAQAAAEQGGCRGPGSMAAQGAAWAQPSTPAAAGAPAATGAAATPRMTPHAVTGSVLMSAAIQANPAVTVPTMTAPAAKAPTAPAAPAAPAAPQLAATPPQAPAAPNAPAAPQAQTPAVVPPAVQAQTFQQQHPFIKMGLDIASGKAPV